MNLNALDKERIAAAVKWTEENPARNDNALEILDADSAIQDKEQNLKPLEDGQSTKG
jgi:hypothetical protein